VYFVDQQKKCKSKFARDVSLRTGMDTIVHIFPALSKIDRRMMLKARLNTQAPIALLSSAVG
jgi:hypothetical protein